MYYTVTKTDNLELAKNEGPFVSMKEAFRSALRLESETGLEVDILRRDVKLEN